MNQRSRAASATAATPSARTVAARSSHCSRGGKLGAVAAENEAVDPLRRLRREPHADDPADRKAAERDTLEAELVEQAEGVAAQIVDRVRARRDRRAAVAAAVVAEEPEARRERGKLRVPHLERRPERVAEQQRWSVGRSVEPVVQVTIDLAGSSRRTRARGRRAARADPRYVDGSRAASSSAASRPVRGSARSASRKLVSAAAASRTTSCASARPSRSGSRNATRSASTRPPVRSRFARIPAASTSSDSSAPASAASAPPVCASAPESASHSACQAPAARSCSCSSDPSRTPA